MLFQDISQELPKLLLQMINTPETLQHNLRLELVWNVHADICIVEVDKRGCYWLKIKTDIQSRYGTLGWNTHF